MTEVFTIATAAKFLNVTRQAVYIAVKSKKLKAYQLPNGRWNMHRDSLIEYDRGKYKRENCLDREGNLLFDHQKGFYSPRQIAEKLNLRTQNVYFFIRMGYVPVKRFGAAYILQEADMVKFLETRNR